MRMSTSFFGIRTQLLLGIALFVSVTVPVTFAANPTVLSFSPADNATSVTPLSQNLIITFSETIVGTGGTVSLYKSDGTLVETIQGNSGGITINSAVATINPTNDLVKNTDYYVQIASNAFQNGTSEYYAGISDTTTWNFRTIGGGAGAAARRARAAAIASMPQFYNTEAPSLEDVGIFKEHSAAESVEQVAKAPQLPARLVRTGYDPSGVERFSRLQRRITQVAFAGIAEDTSNEEEQEYESNKHRRTCLRVESRFAGNEKIIERINRRLLRNEGYTCDL